MKRASDTGYILAGATLSVFVLSALAAGLAALAIGELRRVKAAEDWLVERSLYEAVVALSAAELSLEPDARTLRFDDAAETLAVEGSRFDVSLAWESEKIDLNAARLEVVESAGRAAGLADASLEALLDALAARRDDARPLRLLEDLPVEDAQRLACLRSAYTVFGGRRRLGEQVDLVGAFDRPTPGTRLAMTVRRAPDGRYAEVVVLMTGDPVDPARIQDWRWVDESSETVCLDGR